ncbi:GNAT family N-acetyltransferase [Pseudonocardia sp. CA-107938]|uniref:GNAT family N-acetyltransferase n=1 Tax=Pseudonocardia sp. CA-107938 TaxID=3240021 RepID=UPI003D91AE10
MTDEITLHRVWAPDLTAEQLYRLLRLRTDVFVVEQHCAYPELDGRDLERRTRHLWLAPAGDPGTVLGYLRLLVEPDGAHRIGRVCTAATARGTGLAHRLLAAALAEAGDGACVLDAQEHLAAFYSGYGFVPSGPVYEWDGVPHLPMLRAAR